jgi:hypothetical protein
MCHAERLERPYRVWHCVVSGAALCRGPEADDSVSLLHASDLAHVKQVFYHRAEDRPVSREELRRGYQYEKDRYIVLEDRELEGIAPRSSRTMELRLRAGGRDRSGVSGCLVLCAARRCRPEALHAAL